MNGSPSLAGRSRRGGKGRSRKAESPEREYDRTTQRRGLPKEPPEDAPTGPLVDYLRKQDVIVYEGQDDLARNEAFEHLARHIGTHFDIVGPFYEKMKRAVASGHGQRIDIERWSERERGAAVQLGTMLHRHGLLKDFYYHRSPKKQLRVIPTKDGSTAQFLTGGWLEIYVSWLLTRRLKARMSPSKFQVLFNVKGTLPNLREFEADLMANVDGRMLWVECKTGNWQDYSARFKGLVKIFGCDRQSAALLLIRPPDSSTRGRATDMLDMTLISLEEVDGFMNRFLGISEQEAARYRMREREHDPKDRTAPLPVGMAPPLSEDETPLEDAAPARKLGHVDLDGGDPAAAVGGTRRRRRGRRGGRGRRRSSAGDDAAKLNQPLPIEPITGEAEAEQAEPASGDKEAKGSGEERGSRRRRRRRSSPFAEGEKTAEAALESAKETLAGLAAAVEADAAASSESPAAADPEEAVETAATAEDGTGPSPESAEGEGGSKPRRRRRRRRKAGEEQGREAAEGADAPEGDAPAAADSSKKTVEAKPPAAEEDKPRRRRRRKSKAEVEAEAKAKAEAEERGEIPTGEETAADEPVAAEAVAEIVAAEAPSEQTRPETVPVAEKEPEAEAEPEVDSEPEPEPEIEAEPEAELPTEEKKSAAGVTISPDLAAMFAQPAGKKEKD